MKATLRVATGMVALSALAGALLVTASGSAGAAGQKKSIDPEADRLLHQMSETLAGLKSFRLRSSAVDEVVTTAGQKIQVVSDSDVSVERPNRLRSQQLGAENGLGFWYDGQTMTLACKNSNTYASAPAPANLDDAIDKARKQFQIEAPGADLLYSHPYEILTEQVTSGKFIGRETVDGQAANHLAFQGEDVDWQIWIADGPQALPLRFVITSKKVKGSPEFEVRMTDWQTSPKLGAAAFAFEAPAGAKQVQSFPSECHGGGH